MECLKKKKIVEELKKKKEKAFDYYKHQAQFKIGDLVEVDIAHAEEMDSTYDEYVKPNNGRVGVIIKNENEDNELMKDHAFWAIKFIDNDEVCGFWPEELKFASKDEE